jgi:hypothetical protein
MHARASRTTKIGVAFARADWIAAFQGYALGTFGVLGIPSYVRVDASVGNNFDRRRVVGTNPKTASAAIAHASEEGPVEMDREVFDPATGRQSWSVS